MHGERKSTLNTLQEQVRLSRIQLLADRSGNQIERVQIPQSSPKSKQKFDSIYALGLAEQWKNMSFIIASESQNPMTRATIDLESQRHGTDISSTTHVIPSTLSLNQFQ